VCDIFISYLMNILHLYDGELWEAHFWHLCEISEEKKEACNMLHDSFFSSESCNMLLKLHAYVERQVVHV
jgi:hypothetical protein